MSDGLEYKLTWSTWGARLTHPEDRVFETCDHRRSTLEEKVAQYEEAGFNTESLQPEEGEGAKLCLKAVQPEETELLVSCLVVDTAVSASMTLCKGPPFGEAPQMPRLPRGD